MSRTVWLAICVLTFSACGVRENIRPDSPPQLQAESALILLGLDPSSRIHLLRGAAENGAWHRPIIDTPEVNAFPEDGYIFVKVKPTAPSERLGISLVFPNGRPYTPCTGAVLPTWALKPGVVNYLGELTVTVDDRGELRFSYALHEHRARAFLDASYPGYVDYFETQPATPMTVKGGICRLKGARWSL